MSDLSNEGLYKPLTIPAKVKHTGDWTNEGLSSLMIGLIKYYTHTHTGD